MIEVNLDQPWDRNGYLPDRMPVPPLWGPCLDDILKKGLPRLGTTLYPLRRYLDPSHVEYEDGPEIFSAPYLDNDTIAGELLARYDAFSRICQTGDSETSETACIVPTIQQMLCLWGIHARHWIYVDKYRQARITTIFLTWLLRDCMYLSGINGVLLANTEEVGKECFRRLRNMYNTLPDEVKVRRAKGKTGSDYAIEFEHGGTIQVLWISGKSQGLGRSIDRLAVTEWGLAPRAQAAVSRVIPAFNRRPNARVVWETTPGMDQSTAQAHWLDALERGFSPDAEAIPARVAYPIFLEYHRDATCAIKDAVLTDHTEAEVQLQKECPGLTDGHLAFRRSFTRQFLKGQYAHFEHAYPRSPYHGWQGTQNVVLPSDAIAVLMEKALREHETPLHPVGRCNVITEPIIGREYLLVADGAKAGDGEDPSAFTVFDRVTWDEVAWWAGRCQPGEFADRIMSASFFYGRPEHDEGNGRAKVKRCLTCVEANAGEVVELLKREGHGNLWFRRRATGNEGWLMTAKSKNAAVGILIDVLTNQEVSIRSIGTLQQLLGFDGRSRAERPIQEDGARHHYDRAITILIGVAVLAGYTGLGEPSMTRTGRPSYRARVERTPTNNGYKDANVIDAICESDLDVDELGLRPAGYVYGSDFKRKPKQRR